MAEIEIKLKGLAQIKSELRELKGELANATDPAQMAKLAEQAGKLKDQLADANEQVAVFSTGSKFEQVSNSFSSMKDSLLSMDFEEASQKAKMFQKTLSSISPATIGAGIKGLISTVGTLSKAFIQFGLALMANPIFLLVAAIAAVVAGIVYFLNKLGILKVILKAIGDVVDWLVQGFKDLTDWIGITNHAQTKQAEESAKALSEEREGLKKVIGQMDQKIALLNAEGQSTIALRQEKNKLMKQDAASTEASIKSVQSMFEKDSVMFKAYGDLVDNSTKAVQTLEVEEKKLTQESEDENKKRSDSHKKYLEERLSASRLVQDLTIGLMNEGVQKELALNKIKFDRSIEDLKKEAKYTSDEKIRLAALYAEEQFQSEKAIRLKYQEDLDTSIAATTASRKAKADENRALEVQAYKDAAAAIQLIAEEDAKKKIQLEKDVMNAKLSMASDAIGAIASLTEAFAGKSEKSAKRAFDINKAASMAQAVIATYQGANAIFASAAANPATVLFPAQPFIAAGIAIASGLANVTKIARTKFGSASSGGGGGGSAPSMGGGGTSTQAATPAAPQMFGANNNANTFGATGSQANQPMVVKAVVVESDITSMQSKINKIQQSAVL